MLLVAAFTTILSLQLAQGWTVVESKNKIDDTREVRLIKRGNSPGTSLVVSCRSGETDVVVNMNELAQNQDVRTRFDAERPSSEKWNRSTDYKALFAPDPIALARKFLSTKRFLIEFTPFQKASKVLEFDLAGLVSVLPKVWEACDWAAYDRAAWEIDQARKEFDELLKKSEANAARMAAERAERQEKVDKVAAERAAADLSLRAQFEGYIHECPSSFPPRRWCWTDPDDVYFSKERMGYATKEEALDAAIGVARAGSAFKKSQGLFQSK